MGEYSFTTEETEDTHDSMTVSKSENSTMSAEASVPNTAKTIVLKGCRMDFTSSPQSWDLDGGHGKVFGFCNGKQKTFFSF